MGRQGKDFPLDELVVEAEKWQTSLSLPGPVLGRLEDLVDQAIKAGESRQLSRLELLAALICNAPEEPKTLQKALVKYRLAKTRAVMVQDKIQALTPGANVIFIEKFRPGRRAR